MVGITRKQYINKKMYIRELSCKWSYKKYMEIWTEVYLYEYYHDILEKTERPTIEMYEKKQGERLKRIYGEECLNHTSEKEI